MAFLLIPQAMAYAELAGLKAYYGLYAAFIPVILGALFGSLNQLGTGPVAMTSIVMASVLSAFAVPCSEEYVQMAIMLAFLVGIIRLSLGLFRLAALVNFISHPVITGFTNAGAIIIGLSQINKIFGLEIGNSRYLFGFLYDISRMLGELDKLHLPTLLMGLGAIVTIFLIKRLRSRWPALLITVVLSITVSYLIGYESNLGGKVVGAIPRGLPQFGLFFGSWPDLRSLFLTAGKLFPGALVIALISFMEVLSVSKAISLKTGQPLDLNQELIGQGVAAIGGSFAQAYPSSGSFSRSAMNLMAGGKSGMSSVFTGLIVMLVLLFFTPLMYYLPKAVLAAAVIAAVFGLINFKLIVRSWRASHSDGIIALITFTATLCFAPNIAAGILIGAALALILYLHHTMKPRIVVLGRHPDGTLRDALRNRLETSEYIIALRVDGSLYFASVASFEDSVIEAINKHPKARYFLLASEGINRIDASGEWSLMQLAGRLKEKNIKFIIAGMKNAPMDILRSTGFVKEIGEESFFPSADTAVEYIYGYLLEDGIETPILLRNEDKIKPSEQD